MRSIWRKTCARSGGLTPNSFMFLCFARTVGDLTSKATSKNIARRLSLLLSEAKMEFKSANARTYESAIRALNSLQSNPQTLAIIKQQTLDHRVHAIPRAIQFAQRVGITLDDIDRLSVIHITGTKGKGSTCAICESILHHHGYKTGFSSSPHLVEARERIRINGKPISTELFSKYFWEVYDKLVQTKEDHNGEMPFYFAFMTIMAFHVFLHEKVDVAIMEVGIGGQYDTTNVLRKPVVCGVTSLGLDHTSILGKTIEEIAWSKGGIFKSGAPAVTIPQVHPSSLDVLLRRSKEIGCPLFLAPSFEDYQVSTPDHHLELGIVGKVQKTNAALALQLCNIWLRRHNNDEQLSCLKDHADVFSAVNIPVLEAFPVDSLSAQGLKNCSWPGRNQILRKSGLTYYLDGAHTKESLEQCIDWFESESVQEAAKVSGKVVRILIFNMTGDRNIPARLEQLQACVFDHVVFCSNYLYFKSTTQDMTRIFVTQENQLNKCTTMKEFWDRSSSIGSDPKNRSLDDGSTIHLSASTKEIPPSTKTTMTNTVKSSSISSSIPLAGPSGRPTGQTTQDIANQNEDMKLPAVSQHIPSSVIRCISHALRWSSQGRDADLNSCCDRLLDDVPTYLRDSAHVQILVTGSLHLVGGVLKLIDPDLSTIV